MALHRHIPVTEILFLLFVYILDIVYKFGLLVFWLDSCHGAGGSPNHRICDPQVIPFWTALGVPLGVDFVVLLVLILFITRSPLSQARTGWHVLLTWALCLLYALWAVISAFVIWRLPFFDAPL